MKLDYEISEFAKEDIEQIWQFTYEKWSRTQADRYFKLIVSEFKFLVKNPEIGRRIDYIKKDHRVRNIKSHIIVYKIKNEKIWIDRILHKNMDLEFKLGK